MTSTFHANKKITHIIAQYFSKFNWNEEGNKSMYSYVYLICSDLN